jgi:hypothetical protein
MPRTPTTCLAMALDESCNRVADRRSRDGDMLSFHVFIAFNEPFVENGAADRITFRAIRCLPSLCDEPLHDEL